MTHEPLSEIQRRDEMLELFYWLEGEGFPGSATLSGIARFLVRSESETATTLAALVEHGDIVALADRTGEYRLTETGRREAARRFAEEFAPFLAQGHGECNNPECDCHSNPLGSAECHARQQVGRESG